MQILRLTIRSARLLAAWPHSSALKSRTTRRRVRPATLSAKLSFGPPPGPHQPSPPNLSGFGQPATVTLARLFRAGELTSVWVPDPTHEAIRDLVRARETIARDLRKKRQHLLSFLLRHGRIYSGRKHWTHAHAVWLAAQSFEHPAQQIVFQDSVDAIDDAANRLHRVEHQLREIVPSWSMAPVVECYQAMRGVSFILAVTFASEIGDVRRFANPRQLMAFLGLVPSERSTGETVHRGGLTLCGNRRARRALVEGAWTYRYPARVSSRLQPRLEGLPKPVRDIAWKAQIRLCSRYRRLTSAGKQTPVVVAAIAREMAAFLWDIARHVTPAIVVPTAPQASRRARRPQGRFAPPPAVACGQP